jgi:hypothetical protein
MSAADLLAEDAGEDIGGASCRQRDDDLNRPRGLRVRSLSIRREKVVGGGRYGERNGDAI